MLDEGSMFNWSAGQFKGSGISEYLGFSYSTLIHSHVSVTLSFKINQNIHILEAVNNVLYAKWQGP